MTCDKCRHMKDISKLFRECANCPSHGDRCATCEVYLARKREAARIGTYCENCGTGRVVHYDGAPGGLASVIAGAGGIAADALRKSNANATGVTQLDPATEDKLRVVLSSIMGLDPLDLLLVQHIFNQRKKSKFVETAKKLRDQLNGYKLSDTEVGESATGWGANVCYWSKRILARVPELAGVFATNRAGAAGAY